MDDSTTKRCTRCGVDKPLVEFPPAKGYKHGVNSRCRACVREYQRAYEKTPNRREYQRQFDKGEKRKAQKLQRWHERYDTDPAFREKQRQRTKDRYHSNDEYREGMIALQQERYAVPEIRHRILKRAHERSKSGHYREYDRQRRNLPHRRALHNVFVKRRQRRKKGATGSHTLQEWNALCERYGHICLACGQRLPLTEDHIVPLVKGGTDDISNIQPLCRPCNSRKGTQTTDYRPTQEVGE